MNSTLRVLDSDDDDGPYRSANYTIVSTVSIRVTPRHDHLVPWGILWGCFFLTSMFAVWQVRIERSQRTREEAEHGPSTADVIRSVFRLLLVAAMISRLILMPVQIWSDPVWWQFVGDTLPEMIFASAWTLLVSFFVQLVGIAMGVGSSHSPGIVIQATAYVVYISLITTQVWNNVASVLLYALLCCIYAGLFGTILYFGPRLISILQPSLTRNRGLAVRLLTACALLLILCAAHMVNFARLVVAPPRKVYWWYNYGILEMLPSIVFLILMHPSSHKVDRTADLSKTADEESGSRKPLRRVDSGGSGTGVRSKNETTALLKGSPSSYGGTGEVN